MRKEYDLGRLKRRPGKIKADKSATKIQVGLRLDGSDLARLKSPLRLASDPAAFSARRSASAFKYEISATTCF